eukprot:m.356353 g.356353  ORF g.356353 m.356353 type:complete len:212 (+) comp17517_c0_seq1:213-848(+)
MVLDFTTEVDGKTYFLYMGKDKFENEELIQYGWPEDVWFHVDKLSSAHVYVRMPEGEAWTDMPEQLIIDCCQLVKANSIEGCKKSNVSIVYTPWSNLKKTSDMAVGQVSFHKSRLVKKFLVEKKDTAIIKRITKTREERFPDLRQEQEDRRIRQERADRAVEAARKEMERLQVEEAKREAEMRSYDRLMDPDSMTTNDHGMSVEDFEDDFM